MANSNCNHNDKTTASFPELLQTSKNLETAIRNGEIESAEALVKRLARMKAPVVINLDYDVDMLRVPRKIWLKVTVKDGSGFETVIDLNVDTCTTIGAIKALIYNQVKFPPELQYCLVGKQLRHNKETLENCGITSDNSNISIYIAPPDTEVLLQLRRDRILPNAILANEALLDYENGMIFTDSSTSVADGQKQPQPAPVVNHRNALNVLPVQKPELSNDVILVNSGTDLASVLSATAARGSRSDVRISHSDTVTVPVQSASDVVIVDDVLLPVASETDVTNVPQPLARGGKRKHSLDGSAEDCRNVRRNVGDLQTGNDSQEGKWSCEMCTYLNHPDIMECELCSTRRRGAPNAEPLYATDGGQAEVQPSTSNAENVGMGSYADLVKFDQSRVIKNIEKFQCPICFDDFGKGKGVLLRECLHMFCRACLKEHIRLSENATVKCPFDNGEYRCESELLEREIKGLVSAKVYEKHLQRSLVQAESQAPNSYHCATLNCAGWCTYEDAVNTFFCYICNHWNCLTCQAIHEEMNCAEYQQKLKDEVGLDEASKKSKAKLDEMLKKGEAMNCPTCRVVIMKKSGCDWLQCTMCKTEICWVTRQARWGPKGPGDTSGGCRCRVNQQLCHPRCGNCH